MNKAKIIILLFCLTLTTTSTIGTSVQKENDPEETVSGTPLKQKCLESDKDCDIDYSNSNETGPLDSHEAMNNREFHRNKRSSDIDKRIFRNMLLGLVHKKSEEIKKRDQETQTESVQFQSDASELLLELMVRIAAHPQQWNEVHELLKKIDNDIMTSKKILTDLEEDQEEATTTTTTTTPQPTTITEPTENNTVGDVQRLIILLDNEEQRSRNRSNSINEWPNLEDSKQIKEKEEKINSENMYPWNKAPLKPAFSKEKEFTFHRVTGKPLHHRSSLDKTRNAYVAVSIGPKNKDNLLEDELRQLKPWNHQDNLNRMENLRKKWFLQPNRQ